jgi:hypothetical protein
VNKTIPACYHEAAVGSRSNRLHEVGYAGGYKTADFKRRLQAGKEHPISRRPGNHRGCGSIRQGIESGRAIRLSMFINQRSQRQRAAFAEDELGRCKTSQNTIFSCRTVAKCILKTQSGQGTEWYNTGEQRIAT